MVTRKVALLSGGSVCHAVSVSISVSAITCAARQSSDVKQMHVVPHSPLWIFGRIWLIHKRMVPQAG